MNRELWYVAFSHVMCTECDFNYGHDASGEPAKHAAVLARGRKHHADTGHYVQVERGSVMHYGHKFSNTVTPA